jgi:hypothetical protein
MGIRVSLSRHSSHNLHFGQSFAVVAPTPTLLV